jgi:hypothetical protein
MYKKSASGLKFKRRWKKRREHRWRYILLFGVLLRSVIFANTLYWFLLLINETSFSWTMYGITYAAGAIMGLVSGSREYRAHEKRYQEILNWEREESETGTA